MRKSEGCLFFYLQSVQSLLYCAIFLKKRKMWLFPYIIFFSLPKACCYRLWHQKKICFFFFSQPPVMLYRSPLSSDSRDNERKTRKRRIQYTEYTNRQTNKTHKWSFWHSLRSRNSHNAQRLKKAISLSSTDLTNYPCSLIHMLWATQIHEFYIYSNVKACDTAALSGMEKEKLLCWREEELRQQRVFAVTQTCQLGLIQFR